MSLPIPDYAAFRAGCGLLKGCRIMEEQRTNLQVEDLHIYYYTQNGLVRAVNGVSFQVKTDEVFGLVGESGCGKTTLALGVLRLVQPPGRIESGKILFDGLDLVRADDSQIRALRWKEIAYVPQGAMSSLNPVMRLREQFWDVVLDHDGRLSSAATDAYFERLLAGVHLQPSVLNKFPHELSGGMKQRACIALAMVLQPRLIIADEPTSALDVVSQRVVLETLSEARRELHASMIMIGHDMALQAQIADRLGIMYNGNFMEIGSVEDIFNNPLHPYTQRLISSIPSIHERQNVRELARTDITESEWLRFEKVIALEEAGPGHFVAQHD